MSTFQRLKVGGWLHEDTINFYFMMLNRLRIDGCHCYPTHFMQLVMDKRDNMNKRRQLINFEKWGKVFFPVNTGSHWCLIVVKPRMATIEVYDSMSSRDNKKYYEQLITYLNYGVLARNWIVRNQECPQQDNYYDCGVHTILNAHLLTFSISLDYSYEQVTSFRKTIAFFICKGGIDLVSTQPVSLTAQQGSNKKRGSNFFIL
jgi:Ulp1 family protease